MYCFSKRYTVTNITLSIDSSGNAGAVSISSLRSDFYMVNGLGRHTQQSMLMCSTGFQFLISDESGAASGGRDGLPLCVWGFRTPSHIWLLPGWEVTCCISTFLGTLSIVSIRSPNVVSADEVPAFAIWDWTTAGTFNWVGPYFLFLTRKWLAVSRQPGRDNGSSFICSCRKRSMRCWASVRTPTPISSRRRKRWYTVAHESEWV